MRRFTVTWQFASGYEMPRVSWVMAQDRKQAEQRVWLLHVEMSSQLRSKIEFLSVKEEKG